MSNLVSYGMLAVGLGSAAIGAGRKVLERLKARRALRDKLPLDKGSAEGTVVRITGVVQPLDDTLTAPLSGGSCVVVRSRVVSGFKLMRRALGPVERLSIVPFIIDRGAEGRVLVEGKHVLLDLPPVAKRGRFDESRRRQFLITQGVSLREIDRAQFEETVLVPGARVSVAGLMMKDLPSEPVAEELGFRDTAPPNLRIAGNVDHPLVIGQPVD